MDTNDRPTRHPYPGPERFQLEQMGDLGTVNLSVSHLAVAMENVKPSNSNSRVPLWQQAIDHPLWGRVLPDVLRRQ